MQIKKENLIADREYFVAQAKAAQAVVNYIDSQMAYLDKEEPKEAECEKPASA